MKIVRLVAAPIFAQPPADLTLGAKWSTWYAVSKTWIMPWAVADPKRFLQL
jgi:hypothetical protein